MLMTPLRLVILRLYCITLGRVRFFSRLLRKILVRILITGKEEKYVASSKFFDWRDLGK